MSSEQENQDKKEPVDIDQLEVSIFIIAKNPNQLNNSAQFLTRRGWPTECLGSISKAISTIVNESPDIVMISVDHPNPNVSRLPILLAQTLNTLCIGFTEDGGALSINRLNKSKFKYKFNGFPSGPSLHRFIRQTLDSIHNPQEVAPMKAANKKKGILGDDSHIEVKGGAQDNTIRISGDDDNSSGGYGAGSTERKKLRDYQNAGGKDKSQGLSAAEMLQKLNQGDDFDPIKKQNNRLSNFDPTSGQGGYGQGQSGNSQGINSQRGEFGAGNFLGKEGNSPYGSNNQESDGSQSGNSSGNGEFGSGNTGFGNSTGGGQFQQNGSTGGISNSEGQGSNHGSGLYGNEESSDKDSKKKLSLAEQVRSQRGGGQFGDGSQGQDDNGANQTGSDNYFQDVLKNSGTDPDEEDMEAKKARVAAKKKAFPWQKNKLDEDKAIKDQKNRPGATFDLKQERNQLQPDSDDSMVARGKKKGFDLNMSEESKKNRGDYEAEGKGAKKQGVDFPLGVDKDDRSLNQEGSGEGRLNKKMGENSLDLESQTASGEENTLDNLGKKRKSKAAKEIVANGKKLNEEEDKIKQGVQDALQESCEPPDPSVIVEINQTSQIGVIPIDSQKLHGYLLVGRGEESFQGNTLFLNVLSQAVEKHLAVRGLDVTCQEPFYLDTEKFDFNKWANNVENFTLFDQSGREEIAVTFIPTKERVPQMTDSDASPDMAQIAVKHLSVNEPVTFNSYIYFEKNTKFFKYLNTGAKILQRQKNKMLDEKADIKELLINKSEFDNFKKYVAGILINELVAKVNESDSDDEAA